MSFVVVAVVTAGVVIAGTAYQINEAENAKRQTGQRRNEQKEAARQAEGELKSREASEKNLKERDRLRSNQRRRISSNMSNSMTGGVAGIPDASATVAAPSESIGS
jgi:Flp pilus assembly protein TadB